MQWCSVPGAPRGLRKGSSTQRHLECLDGSSAAAAFVVDFEVEGVVEQHGETRPLTELVLAECNFKGKCFIQSKLYGLSLSLTPYLNYLCNLFLFSFMDIRGIVRYWI